MRTEERIALDILGARELKTLRSVLVFAGLNQPATIKDIKSSVEVAVSNMTEILEKRGESISLNAILRLATVYEDLGVTYLNNVNSFKEIEDSKYGVKPCNMDICENVQVYFIHKNDNTIVDVISKVDGFFSASYNKIINFVISFGIPVFNFDKDAVYIPDDNGICLDWRKYKTDDSWEEKLLDNSFITYRGYRPCPITIESKLVPFLYTFYKEFSTDDIDLVEFIKSKKYKQDGIKHITGLINCNTARNYRFKNPQALRLEELSPDNQIDTLLDEFGRVVGLYSYLDKEDFDKKISEIKKEFIEYLELIQEYAIISNTVLHSVSKLI